MNYHAQLLAAPRRKPLGMTRPVIRSWVRGQPVEHTCGRQAVENMARAYWQSRHDLLEPPQLIDLPALALNVRVSFMRERYARDAMADAEPTTDFYGE